MNFWVKLGLFCFGTAMATIATTYNAHASAPLMAYVAAVCGSVGGILVGAFMLNRPDEAPQAASGASAGPQITKLIPALVLAVALLAWTAPASAAFPCTQAGQLAPAGYQQLTVSTTAVSLTVPTNAVYAVVIVATNTLRVRDDGTAPTSAVGMPYGATTFPQTFTICGGAALAGTQLIRISSDSEVNVSYYK